MNSRPTAPKAVALARLRYAPDVKGVTYPRQSASATPAVAAQLSRNTGRGSRSGGACYRAAGWTAAVSAVSHPAPLFRSSPHCRSGSGDRRGAGPDPLCFDLRRAARGTQDLRDDRGGQVGRQTSWSASRAMPKPCVGRPNGYCGGRAGKSSVPEPSTLDFRSRNCTFTELHTACVRTGRRRTGESSGLECANAPGGES